MRTRHVSRIVGAVALVLVYAGLASAADTPDAWVTMKTKVSLMTTEGLSAMDLNVDTVKGVVTLHGKVATEAEKAKAETGRARHRRRQRGQEPAAGGAERSTRGRGTLRRPHQEGHR